MSGQRHTVGQRQQAWGWCHCSCCSCWFWRQNEREKKKRDQSKWAIHERMLTHSQTDLIGDHAPPLLQYTETVHGTNIFTAKLKMEWEVRLACVNHYLLVTFNNSCGCTVLGMLKSRQTLQQTDWWAKQPSQMVHALEEFMWWRLWLHVWSGIPVKRTYDCFHSVCETRHWGVVTCWLPLKLYPDFIHFC